MCPATSALSPSEKAETIIEQGRLAVRGNDDGHRRRAVLHWSVVNLSLVTLQPIR